MFPSPMRGVLLGAGLGLLLWTPLIYWVLS